MWQGPRLLLLSCGAGGVWRTGKEARYPLTPRPYPRNQDTRGAPAACARATGILSPPFGGLQSAC